MLRRLGMVGLGVPLVAVIVGLIFLYAFGTDEPTFDAATRELAHDHTLVYLSDDPPAALVVPAQPPESAPVFVILADDQRHIWSAVRDLGLLEEIERREIALLVAPGASATQLKALVEAVVEYVPVDFAVLTAFGGRQIRSLCPEWELAVVVGDASVSCEAARSTSVPPGDNLGRRIVDAAIELSEGQASP